MTRSPATKASGRLRADLLAWFDERRRDFPWRNTRDPWLILVSELMLQQTQADRVVPKFEEFIARWPDPPACAAASSGDVVRAWQGLGYNRRAINLHRAATIITEAHGGQVPDTHEELVALPGIGPYTSRAVLAFAFERDVGIVDVNVARTVSRIRGTSLGRAALQHEADALVPPGDGWTWNQAMLDLGATVCTARSPDCTSCPVAAHCEWFRLGNAPPDPASTSAGASRPQARFEGSDRQARGRLVDALRHADVVVDDLPTVMGLPDDPERAAAVAERVVRDGLAVEDRGWLRLPA